MLSFGGKRITKEMTTKNQMTATKIKKCVIITLIR